MANPDLEDRTALELERDYETALAESHPTLESARREGGRFVAYNEPTGDALIHAIANLDDCWKEAVAAGLRNAVRRDQSLRGALASQVASDNAMGVTAVRYAHFAEELGL